MREPRVPTTRQPRRTDKILRGPLRRALPLLALALSALALSLPAAASADIGICSAGTTAGQCENPQGLATDFETGRLYVADSGNRRVDVFEDGPEHKFAFAFGWGVANGEPELQSCGPQATPPTANCLKGLRGGGAGALEELSEVAIDNDPASPSQHAIYVLDGKRIQKFGPEGNFLLTFGGGVITGGASGTGDLTSGSNQITSVQTTAKRFAVGQTITGAGIPAETKVLALSFPPNPPTITLSKPATASGTGVALSVAAGPGNKPANEVDRLVNKGPPLGSPNFRFNTPAPNPPPSQTETGQLPNATTCPELQAAFEALPNVGAGNIACIGEEVEGEVHEYTVEFKGPRYSDTDVTLQAGNSGGNRDVITVENGGGAAEICTAAIAVSCSAGIKGEGEGQFAESAHLAVGPGGVVHVVDCVGSSEEANCKDRLQRFEPSGDFIEELALPQSGNQPSGLAVDSGGDFYVSFNTAIRKYDAAGNLLKELAVAGGVGTLAIDAADHLVAAESDGRPVITEYDPAGTTLRRFGYGVLKSRPSGLAPFQSPTGDIFSAEAGSVLYRTFPAPGPIVVPEPCTTSFLGNAKATLLAEVNPEGKATTVHFEYVDQKSFEEEGGFASPKTKETAESASIGSDFKLHDAEAQADLVPETKYHCRVVATNADAPGGVTGPEGTFTSKAPLEIGTTTVSGVGTETATLNASVNPLGISASGHFEYVEEATYLKDIEDLGPEHGFDHAVKAPDLDASEAPIDFGTGESFVLGSAQLSDLKPGTSYRFRIVATDVLISPKEIPGPTKPFRTFGAAPGALPDERGYELVTPAQKNGAEVAVPGSNVSGFTEDRFVRIQAGATSGEAVTYTSWTSFGKAEGAPATSQYLSKRSEGGWATENISAFGFIFNPIMPPFSGFSPDLRFGAFKTTEPVLTGDCRKGLEGLYLRDNETGELHCLSLDAPGAPDSPCLVYAGASEDGARAFLAGPPEGGEVLTYSLYEWTATGGVQLVSVLPSGEAAPATSGTAFGPGGGTGVGGGIESCQTTRTALRHAISADGSRAFWTYVPEKAGEPTQLYVRLNGSETVQLDKAANPKNSGNGVFRAASADGSVVYFTDESTLISGASPEKGKPDLYRYQFGVSKALTLTDLTKGPVPGDVKGVVGISDDGSYLYFVAGAVLSEEANGAGQKAEAGKANLYLHHGGETSFIATLAPEDQGDWEANPRELRARVSPDGRHLAFLSIEAEKLAGYENTIAAGEHCQFREATPDGKVQLAGSPLCPQAFLYEAESGELSCASCNPSGARPQGPSVVPGWTNAFEGPRFLSEDGQRLFFQSFDELLPADENGKGDVYEFERPGTGSCSEADESFDPASGGCHFLLSSGKSTDESFLIDVSASGRDVFLSTRQQLVGWDENDNYDVYDARKGGGFPGPPPAPPPCEGEGCKAPPPPPPPAGPAPATPHWQGPGNAATPPSQRCPKGKVRRKARCVKDRGGKSQRQKRDHHRVSGKGRTAR